MNYIIFRSNNEVGRLRFDTDHRPVLMDGADRALSAFLERSLAEGMDAFTDVREGSVRTTVSKPYSQADPIFPLVVQQWLERHGYEVRELHPEIDSAIAEALSRVADTDLVRRIQKQLPTASYLEKTYLLEKLAKNLPKL